MVDLGGYYLPGEDVLLKVVSSLIEAIAFLGIYRMNYFRLSSQ